MKCWAPSIRLTMARGLITAVLFSAASGFGDDRNSARLPKFESKADDVALSLAATQGVIDGKIKTIASLRAAELSFASIFDALDDIQNDIVLARYRFEFLESAHPLESVRSACQIAYADLKNLRTTLYQNAQVYAQVKAYLESKDPRLVAERGSLNQLDRRLIDRVERDFRRNGFHLPEADRRQFAKGLSDLTALMAQHGAAFNKEDWVTFTAKELDGIPADIIARFRQPDGTYHVRTNGEEAPAIYRNSPLAATRKKAYVARMSRAMNENAERGTQIVQLRNRLAKIFGKSNWADYQTEVTMMKDSATAQKFLDELDVAMDPLFREDLVALGRYKAKELNAPDAKVEIWDVEYFTSQRLRSEFDVDVSQLREFFEYEHTLKMLFGVAEQVFAIKIVDRPLAEKWHSDVTAIDICDAQSGMQLGTVYLDMYPRDGKANSFSCWGIVPARSNHTGTQRPVAALLCNFARPAEASPTLLDFKDVQTLFHEFGHALHEVLGQTKYTTFSGMVVEADFREAPAVMLEEFITDKNVLGRIARHYKDPTRHFPVDVVGRLSRARAFSARVTDKRVLGLSKMDMAIHTSSEVVEQGFDLTLFTNRVMADVFLPFPEGTSFINTFQHLLEYGDGYDGAYYQYLWASALSADLASKFRDAPDGFLDADVGMRYRREVLEKGASQDAFTSIESFLGRPYDKTAYLRRIGVK